MLKLIPFTMTNPRITESIPLMLLILFLSSQSPAETKHFIFTERPQIGMSADEPFDPIRRFLNDGVEQAGANHFVALRVSTDVRLFDALQDESVAEQKKEFSIIEVRQIKKWMEEIHSYWENILSHCVRVNSPDRSSQLFAQYINQFMSSLSQGVKDSVWHIRKRDFQDFLGGLQHYFSVKQRVFSAYEKFFLLRDENLVRAVKSLSLVLTGDSNATLDGITEPLLSDALSALHHRDARHCTAGKAIIDETPPVADFSKILFQDSSGAKVSRIRVKPGDYIKITIPVEDYGSGFSFSYIPFGSIHFQSDDRSINFTASAVFDRETGLVEATLSIPSGKKHSLYRITALSGLKDRLGNTMNQEPTYSIEIPVDSDNPVTDAIPPKVDFSRIHYESKGGRRGSGNEYVAMAGESLTITVPIEDKGKQIKSNAGEYLSLRSKDPKTPAVISSTSVFGIFDPVTNEARFQFKSHNPYSDTTVYEVVHIGGFKNTSGSEIINESPITPIRITFIGENPDHTPPTVDLKGIRVYTNGKKLDLPAKVKKGEEIFLTIPVYDEISGISEQYTMLIYLASTVDFMRSIDSRFFFYDSATRRLRSRFVIPQDAASGPYRLFIGNLTDRAVNSYSTPKDSPIVIEVVP